MNARTALRGLAASITVLAVLIAAFFQLPGTALAEADDQQTVTLTITWSSIDGATPLEDTVIEIPVGSSFDDLPEDQKNAIFAAFAAVEGYKPIDSRWLVLTSEPITSCAATAMR